MKLFIVLLTGAFMLAAGTSDVFARKKEKVQTEAKSDTVQTVSRKRNTQYPRLFKNKRVVTKKGLITVHKIDDKLYFEFPKSLLGRDFLMGSSISATSDNTSGLVGQTMTTPLHIRFAIQEDQVYMQNVTPVSRMDVYSNQPDINKAVAKSNITPDMESFKIAAYNMDSTAVVFEVTKFFLADNKRLPLFDQNSASLEDEKYGKLELKAVLKKNLSSIRNFYVFDDNLEINLDMSFYQSLLANKKEVRGGSVRVKAIYSMLLLPEEVMTWRLGDPRLGYTYTQKQKISTEKDGTAFSYLQHKWNLLPADEEAYRRGDLVAPQKPILFYIDTDFPEAWKKAIKEGVNWWNEAFKMAGFKDAVQTADFPANDTTFYAGNLRYSCIRYVPVNLSKTQSKVWVDPRSGEIINGTIFVGHDVVKTIASQRFVQTAQADKRMRDLQLSEEVLLESIRLYIAREVGHCLGLADNASASAAFSVESLRSPEFTGQNGIASSVMDELPYNYIAQPQDGKVNFVQNKLGAYDLYAIQMGYMLIPDAKSPEEIREKIMKWVSMKSGDPVYRYGKAQYQDAEYDPSALGGDLGNDAVKAGKYGISNLKYILENMDEWMEQQDSDYRFRIHIYPEIVNQYNQYLMYAFQNVGGFYLSEHRVGDRNQALSVVSKAQQREAARFVMNELCNMTWLDDSSILRNMPVQTPVYQKMIKNFASALVATKRVSLAFYKDKGSYSPEEYLNDIYNGVWASTLKGKSLNRAEILLQYEVVAAILKKLQLPNHMETTGREKKKKKVETLLQSIQPEVNTVGGFGPLGYITNLSNDNQLHLYHGLLIRIQKLMESRLNSGSYETRMHYGQLLEKIEDIRNW